MEANHMVAQEERVDEAVVVPLSDGGADGALAPIEFERRRHPRYNVRQFGKIYDWRSRRYIPCMTCNVSAGGAFIELARPLPFQRGDRILMGFSNSQRPALFRASDLFEVEVMRAHITPDGRQGLGVRFLNADRATVEPTQLRLAA
jgi:hypothetical protein